MKFFCWIHWTVQHVINYFCKSLSRRHTTNACWPTLFCWSCVWGFRLHQITCVTLACVVELSDVGESICEDVGEIRLWRHQWRQINSNVCQQIHFRSPWYPPRYSCCSWPIQRRRATHTDILIDLLRLRLRSSCSHWNTGRRVISILCGHQQQTWPLPSRHPSLVGHLW